MRNQTKGKVKVFFLYYCCGCCLGSRLVALLKGSNYHPRGEGHKSGKKREWSAPSAGHCSFTRDPSMWSSLCWMLSTHSDAWQGRTFIDRSKRRGDSHTAHTACRAPGSKVLQDTNDVPNRCVHSCWPINAALIQNTRGPNVRPNNSINLWERCEPKRSQKPRNGCVTFFPSRAEEKNSQSMN